MENHPSHVLKTLKTGEEVMESIAMKYQSLLKQASAEKQAGGRKDVSQNYRGVLSKVLDIEAA